MAIHVLLMIVTYCRPGELLQSEQDDLIKPMHGVASDWTLLLHTVHRGVPSKTQNYDDTIDLNSKIYPLGYQGRRSSAKRLPLTGNLPVLVRRLLQGISKNDPSAGLPDVVFCQYRHSGASLDKAGRHRTMLAIKNGAGGNQTAAPHGTRKRGSWLAYFEVTDSDTVSKPFRSPLRRRPA